MNGFYHLSQLPLPEVEALAARALELRSGAAPRRSPGRALGLLFLSPSLRTQASFQRAAGRLGLELVALQGGIYGLEWQEGTVMDGEAAEHVREAAGVLGRYVDVLAVRAFASMQDLHSDLQDPVLNGFRAHAGIPIVNMESALWHPCQALADWVTLEQLGVPRHGKLVLSWAYHFKSLPHAVANSTLTMAALRGMQVVLLRPEGYDLHPEVIAEARALAAASGGALEIRSDRAGALRGADVVYAKSWGSLGCWGDGSRELALRAGLRDWMVTPEWLGPRARFFHCLPVRRNLKVADAVLDGPSSAVLEQAENRLHAQTAVLEALYA
ncbi:MAG: N-acetylornithine carbamoyltransferase [Planctomycetota bacterium]|nr:MAG: N-acetylornithine carbamoyltransferase [Planctomycetota bacterium]